VQGAKTLSFDDIYICATQAPLEEGILGRAGPDLVRSVNRKTITVSGSMVFSPGTENEVGYLEIVIHEMGQ